MARQVGTSKSLTTLPKRSRSVAIALVVLATVFFAGSDVLTKLLTASVPSLEAAWLRYVGFTSLVLGFTIVSRRWQTLRSRAPRLQVLRGVVLAGSTLIYATGLLYLPVAVAAATNFVSPVFIAALAGYVLGEAIGWRQWAAAFTGLAGVLIVMRPGTEAFDPATLLPVVAAFCFAVGTVATRVIFRSDDSLTTLVHTAVVGLAVLTLPLPLVWIWPKPSDLVLGACIGLFSTAGHGLVIHASRFAEASVLAPFFYLQIVSTTLLGYAVFGSVPDFWTAVGCTVIITSGMVSYLTARVSRVPPP